MRQSCITCAAEQKWYDTCVKHFQQAPAYVRHTCLQNHQTAENKGSSIVVEIRYVSEKKSGVPVTETVFQYSGKTGMFGMYG